MSARTILICIAIGVLLAAVIPLFGTAALVYFEAQP